MNNTKILWLTENYPPRRGGMAQACDRIVTSIRRKGIYIDVAFFNASAYTFKVTTQINGKLIAVPVSDSPAHNLNILFNYISDPSNKLTYTHIVSFGGNTPILALPIYKSWLKTKAITLLRGNDFDVGVHWKRFCEGISDTICCYGIVHHLWNSAFLQVLENKVNQGGQEFFPQIDFTMSS